MNRLYLKHTRADPLYRRVVQMTLLARIVGVSGIQREFRIGYSRACRLRDWMVAERVINYDEVHGGWEVIQSRPNRLKIYLPKLK